MAEEERKSSEYEQVAWNLSQQLILQISYLIQQSTANYIAGNLTKCYFHVKEIRTLIFADLNSEEVKELKEFEMKIGSSSVKAKPKISSHPTKDELTYRAMENMYLDKYRTRMMELLNKYGYLISKKADKSKMF